MSDQDPLQDSFEQLLHKPVYRTTDKKIVFGTRKPTDDAVALFGVPLIIEAPFPNERTLQWIPDAFGGERRTVPVETVEGDGVADPPESVVKRSGEFENGYTAIVVSQEVLLKVNEHVSQSLERELGGFLLGNRYRCPSTSRDYVIIDQFSPAKFTESTEVALSFTHEAWAQLSDELSGKFLGKLVVGWYHSHPRMDVFLSSHDMEIQTERFPEPWMVALVLEPEKHRGGFFCARDGRVKPNSPVDFFELLERNSRDSVMAWENYSSLDPVTNEAPNMSAMNTASSTNSGAEEIMAARSQESKKVTKEVKGKRRGRKVFAVLLLIAVLGSLAAGVLNRQRLKGWIQKKIARARMAPVTEPSVPAVQPAVQSQSTQQPTASPLQSPSPNQTTLTASPSAVPARRAPRSPR